MRLNNREYLDIHLADKDYSFEYYESPKIQEIRPKFGKVRHGPNEVIQVYGSNFDCYNHDNCENVKCRFGEDPNYVYVKGT